MILSIRNLSKGFRFPNGKKLNIINQLELNVSPGETVAIMGQSGSGKSTLLSLMGGLDYPDKGEILVNQQDIGKMNENKLTKFRAKNIGFVFQQFYLMPHLTALENVALPLEILKEKNPNQRAKEALQQVGLEKRANHYPNQLSGGESQRVAIARALVIRPVILFADEPTGNLDLQIGDKISELLFGIVEEMKMTMVLVTHNPELAKLCNRTLHLKEGRFT